MQTRTEPQQPRSRDKRDRLLAATALLLQEVPYEEIGTKLIADRSEVSVGSLYRFFPDKDAIFMALLESWRDKLVELMDAHVADPPPSAGAFVDRIVDAYAEFWRAEPGYRQVSLGVSLHLPLTDDRHNVDELADRLFRVLTEHYAATVTPELRPRLVLAVDIAEFLLNQAFRVDPQGDHQILDELKVLLRRYLVVD
jgi:AcrR family transcriptional regulator